MSHGSAYTVERATQQVNGKGQFWGCHCTSSQCFTQSVTTTSPLHGASLSLSLHHFTVLHSVCHCTTSWCFTQSVTTTSPLHGASLSLSLLLHHFTVLPFATRLSNLGETSYFNQHNAVQWIWIPFCLQTWDVHLCFIMSPGKMIFAVLELWLSPLQWVLNWQSF